MPSLRPWPISFREACAFIDDQHRHHKRPQGWKFGIAAVKDQTIVGVVCVGRPVARHLDNGTTAEVTRLCTNGERNACSFLYRAAWRAAKEMGYLRMVTYILGSESGSSLRAAGWRLAHKTKNEEWGREERPRVTKHPIEAKQRWEISCPG